MPFVNEYWFEPQEDKKRLVGQHELLKRSQGGRLIIAPIDLTVPGLRILDTGTSDGHWLFDFQKDHPAEHTLIGTDIDTSRFPEQLPPNMTLLRQNMHEPYPTEWKESFDLVHQRLVMVGSGADPLKPLKPLLDLVKPGGWVQLLECDNVCGPDDGPAMHEFVALMREMFGTMGTPLDMTKNLAGWLRDAGFTKVGEMLVPYCLGAKFPEPELRQLSVDASAAPIRDLASAAQNVPGFKCLTKEQLQTLPGRHQREMREKGAYFPMTIVWAQKPLRD